MAVDCLSINGIDVNSNSTVQDSGTTSDLIGFTSARHANIEANALTIDKRLASRMSVLELNARKEKLNTAN